MEGNTDAAMEFLFNWEPDGPWPLTAVDPDRKQKLIANTFDKSTVKEARTFIEHWNGKRNLYFMVNRVKEYLDTKAKKEHVGWLTALHVDVDPPDPAQGVDVTAHYEDARKDILARLNAYTPPPSVIIASGGGYGAFWLMAEPVEVDGNIEVLESYNRQLEKDLSGDHCWNIDRIMRLPGTINLPDAKKRAKGRVKALAAIVTANWKNVYSLDSFNRYVEEKKPKAKKRLKEGDEDWVERVLKFGPDHEGPRAYDHDRSKALWAVCCALVRRNTSIDDIVAMITDKNNKLSEHVHEQTDPKKYARKQAEKAFDEAKGDFLYNDSGKPYPTQENVRVALSMLEVKLLYNEFSDRAYIEGPDGLPRRRIGDRELNGLYLRIAREFDFRPSIEMFKMMIEDDAFSNTFHPVKDYLNGLKWDGESRIEEWLIRYAGAADNKFTRTVSRIALIAGVRRIRSPGAKYDEIIVLESPQGFNKSTALRTLAANPEWFTDSMPLNAKDKELIELLQGKWIVESPELKGMKFTDVEHHKAMLSRQTDTARLSYGRFASEVPRHSIFFGTTNSTSYLADTTGNRRFWPIKVDEFDVEGLAKVINHLWAEAAFRESQGESIRLPRELWDVAALEQKRREIDDPWEAAIANALTYEEGKVKASDIWNLVNVPIERRIQKDNARLGDIMRGLGWERKKTKYGGSKTEWGYTKGGGMSKLIHIERDHNGNLSVEQEGESLARTVNGPDYWES